MKIKKLYEGVTDGVLNPDDSKIELADEIINTTAEITDGDIVLDDQAANTIASEIKEVDNEIDVEAAAINPGEDEYIGYTFFGLVLFLTGANEGLLPTGSVLGQSLASIGSGFIILPVSMIFGYFIVAAEPAVYVLNKQVEQITAGAISAKTMRITLSIGVSAALGLSMVRILTGISILWILIPGYIIALGLSFAVPKFFTGIAFDSGGVASGVMMSAFVLPYATGACLHLGGNVLTEAFGCVAFVALTPIISIQICGLVYNLKAKHAVKRLISEQETFLDYSESIRKERG